jgi:DNA-directed RNA polymerase subunit A'
VLNPGETPLGVVMLPQLFRAVWIPERVHALNIDRIRLAAERGEVIFLTKFVSSSDDAPTTVDPHFGERMLYAKIVNLAVASQGAAAPASYAEYAQQLIQIGDIVERLPEPYDAVILNRQPSLWQYSMSSQCPVFDPRRNTIGMSMLLTKPFNADFDGDEGNGYFCSTVKSIVEAKLLMSPEANILTTSNCGSVTYKMTFNSPISAYLLSLDAERAAQADAAAERATIVTLTPSEWKEIERTLLVDSSRARTVDARLDEAGIRDWSRDLKRLISLAFPTNLYYKRSYKEDVIAPPPAAARPEDGPPGAAAAPATPAAAAKRLSEFVSAVFDKKPIPQQKKEVVIKHGVFVKGVLTAKDLDELTVLIYHRHGGHAAARFLKELPAILNWYIHRRGFSLTFDDCFVRPRRRAGAGAGGVDAIDIDDALRACTARIRANVDALKAERALNETGERMKDAEISVTLGQSELLGAYIVSSAVTGKESTLLNMIRSGAKGKESNAMQIGGSIGQQFLHGARPPKIIPGDRATVYAEAYSGALEDHGFVSSSFAMGCRPSEFFFHATSSRNGLIRSLL